MKLCVIFHNFAQKSDLKMSENIHNCCRLCLDVESSHVSIFGDATIGLHLRSCLSLTVAPNDPLPTDICMSCVSQLSQFYHFQLNARCSQDWLESSLQEKTKKSGDTKAPVQPLPDSEYNSDSLLEFLNNTANIEEYLNNLGKEDIPSIVNMLDKNEVIEACKLTAFKAIKQPSPKKKEKATKMAMEIDVLDSDAEIVKEIIFKVGPMPGKSENDFHTCYGCKIKYESIQKLSQHVSTCDTASRTCVQCDTLFDSRQKMIEHSMSHTSFPLTCNCKEQFPTKEKLIQHQKTCHNDNTGCTFRCKECGEVSKDRFQLYRHARNHVMKADEKKCDVCGHIFIGNDALEKHKKVHAKTQGAIYRCKICQQTSANHQEMYLHVKKHTAQPKPTCHLCESCGKSFSTNAILMRHSQQHNKDFKCTVCDKSFKNNKEKEAHVLIHNDMVMCDRCGKNVKTYEVRGHTCL